MEIKQLISLESEKNGSIFRLHIPVGASWGSAIDAAYEMLQELHKMSQQASQQMQEVKQESSAGAE